MRLDLLLCRLRFSKSRAVAQHCINEGHIRCNRRRVTRADFTIESGDVLTLPIGRSVKVIAIETLPDRRGPAAEAQSHYRELDGSEPFAIGASDNQKG